MKADYLSTMNEAQRVAVEHTEGPIMVIAGAGSGKTRVLTYRIAHIINKGADPFNILALTFTNKAAKEMKERIKKIVGSQQTQGLWMGTFHSIFARILRVEAEKIGYPRNFTIYDSADSKSLIKSILKQLGLDDKIYKPGLVLSRISSAKNNLISARGYIKNTTIMADDRSSGKPRLSEVYTEYERKCFKSGAMDFDDLLFKTNILLRDHSDVLHKYQHQFKYLLVDEYQDTNYSQYLIVKKLAALNENLCVVGDDAQSIYAFRGANIQNILNFKKDYPDYHLFKLEQNYRSTKNIVHAANSIIGKNQNQIKKDIWTSNDQGDQIRVIGTLTDNEEGKFVANDIFETKQNFQSNNIDFAILYRTNAQSRSFEESLRKLNLPYKIYGGLSFYQRKEIKDILSYFRLSANHNDEEALKRVINYPKRGIGKTTIDNAIIASSNHQTTLWSVFESPLEYGLNLSSAVQDKLQSFISMIRSFRTKLESVPAYDLANEIAATSGILKDLYSDKTPEGVSRYENIQELLNGIKEFTDDSPSPEQINSLSDFLVDVALLTNADNDKEEDRDKITLMTIHASKGLEFPFVYIVGLEENLFPSQLSLNSRSDLEEERRLFYVAITRAEKNATLSYATSRYKWGNLITCEPSRFIEEIDSTFLDMVSQPSASASKEPSTRSSKFQRPGTTVQKSTTPVVPSNLKKVSTSPSAGVIPNENIQVGLTVKHERFGKGKVISLEGNFPNQKATVFFPNTGQKQLLLKFAKLEVM